MLAFPNLGLTPLLFFTPLFLTLLGLRKTSVAAAFRAGFLTSLVIMGGGFYWVVYVIHVFGHLPWAVSALLYLGFCGFGALNFPIFTALATWFDRRFPIESASDRAAALRMTLGLPALFSTVEYAIPKLFPWYLGHGLYRWTYVTQVVEWTGCSFLSFAVFSVGGAAAWGVYSREHRRRFHPLAAVIPASLCAVAVAVSAWRLHQPYDRGGTIAVALVQANIGSIEKMEARLGILARVQTIVERYQSLTDRLLAGANPKPDLILWPETAMPFSLQTPTPFSRQVLDAVRRWNVSLITGAYAESLLDRSRDFNAAYLLEPGRGGKLRMDIYRKNILLAFGEYFPFADYYPKAYDYFPQVSNFEHGREQNIFTLENGTRVGVTVCYEAIKPEFFRRVARQGVHLVVNLTNDSWFGPTAEPYQHAALSTFRAIESRVPLARVTNTGISFVVDRFGRAGPATGVYAEGTLLQTIELPTVPAVTFYLLWGDWFVVLCAGVMVGFLGVSLRRKKNAPLPR